MTILHASSLTALRLGAGILIAGVVGMVAPALATEPAGMLYWISMRGIAQESQASFVSAAYVPTGEWATPFAGCHNRTYYLRSADAAIVQAARTGGETVQIHRGEPGTAPQQSTVICLIQVDL